MSKNSIASYKVINHEEQFSLWPAESENPRGWKEVGKVGTPLQCLDYIEEVWTDMRPLSLREESRGSRLAPRSVGGSERGVAGDSRYKIVINHEEQYSFWPVTQKNPNGWKEVGPSCLARDCLNRLREIYSD